MSLWRDPAVFPVLLDSCVLYPYELRDLLLELAHEHLYRVHWSPQILDDTVRNLLADARSTPEKASRLNERSTTVDPFGCACGASRSFWRSSSRRLSGVWRVRPVSSRRLPRSS